HECRELSVLTESQPAGIGGVFVLETRLVVLAAGQSGPLEVALYRPDEDGATVARTIPADDPAYHTVALRFHRDDGAQAAVLWTDQGPFPIQAREFVPRSADRLELRGHAVEGAEVTTSSATVDPNIWWWICSDLDWGCVLSIAGAWAATFASCGACVLDPSKIVCISCIGAVLSAAGTTLGCDVCR
ncbi:MAG: hypothetical protein ACOC0X_06420, partial [Halobacteriota archaeon]